jgi:hypothetical protein
VAVYLVFLHTARLTCRQVWPLHPLVTYPHLINWDRVLLPGTIRSYTLIYVFFAMHAMELPSPDHHPATGSSMLLSPTASPQSIAKDTPDLLLVVFIHGCAIVMKRSTRYTTNSYFSVSRVLIRPLVDSHLA